MKSSEILGLVTLSHLTRKTLRSFYAASGRSCPISLVAARYIMVPSNHLKLDDVALNVQNRKKLFRGTEQLIKASPA